jgi:hypothetical protein
LAYAYRSLLISRLGRMRESKHVVIRNGMSVVLVATAFPVPEHRAEVIAACDAAISRVHDEPGVELYALQTGTGGRIRREKLI